MSKVLTDKEVFDRLENVHKRGNALVARCPVCGDEHHLYITEKPDKILFYCQKCGAGLDEIRAKLGGNATTTQDTGWFRNKSQNQGQAKPKQEKKAKDHGRQIEYLEYVYCNPDGTEAYRKRRKKFEDGHKIFSFVHKGPDGKPDYHKPAGANNLYNLDKLAQAAPETPLYIVEGEKCADAMTEKGFLATTTNTGANSLNLTDTDWRYIEKFPNRIVIPDNDGPGREYAREWVSRHTRLLDLSKVWPEIPVKGDIADYFEQGGDPEKIRNYQFPPEPEIQKWVATEMGDGQEQDEYYHGIQFMHRDWDNKPIPSDPGNVEQVLNANNYELKFNQNTLMPEAYKDGKLLNIDPNNLCTEIRAICNRERLKINSQDCSAAINYIVAKNSYSPFKEYFDSLQWDGTKRINDFLDCFIIADDLERFGDFMKQMVIKFMLQAVQLVYNNGEVIPWGILVIQGPQGLGKTTLVTRLSPNPDWVLAGQVLNPGNKDDIFNLSKYFLVELGEFGKTMKSDDNELKAYFTSGKTTKRQVYAKYATEIIRHTSYIGTVNERYFLTDPTGNRRYWIVAIEDFDRLKFNQIDIDQLWAEVKYRAFVDGLDFSLSTHEQAIQEQLNYNFMVISNEEQLIRDKLDFSRKAETDWNDITASKLAVVLYGTGGERYAAKVAKTLRQMARQDPRIKVPKNNRCHTYTVPPQRVAPPQPAGKFREGGGKVERIRNPA